MGAPPPPPPHGDNPRTTSGGPNGFPAGTKFDIFVIPEHSAGGGFIYLPSLQPSWNSFMAGVAITLTGVVIGQSLAPAIRSWWQNFSGFGPAGWVLLLIAVGVGAWALGRTQTEKASARGPNSQRPGGGFGQSGPYYNAAPPNGAPPPNHAPPPHSNPPPPPPPPQPETPKRERPQSSWQDEPEPETPGTQEKPRYREEPRHREEPRREEPRREEPRQEEPPRKKERPREKPQEKPRARQEPSPEKPREQSHANSRPSTPREGAPAEAGPPPPQETPKSPPPRPTPTPSADAKSAWEKAREETRRREEERKIKEAELKRKEETARRLRELREREAKERGAREREAREREAKEREKKEQEARERARIEREVREKLEKELKEKADKEAREREAREREAKEREARVRAIREREAREREAREREERERELLRMREEERLRVEADRKAKEAKEKEAQDRKERLERLERERKERLERERLRKEEEEREKAKQQKTGSYAYPSVGERTNMWPNGKPPASSQAPSSATSSPGGRPNPASPNPRPAPSPGSTTTGVRSEETHSYRPYDKPKATPRKKSVSDFSESSWAPSTSTARTTPPPSARGPYTTHDPAKIVVKAVYKFMNQFSKTPVSTIIPGRNNVTDGLVLKIDTPGFQIDDDRRGVGQREWDVKAWTIKLIEVWCPTYAVNAAASNTPGSIPTNHPFFKTMPTGARRTAERGATKTFVGEEAVAYFEELGRGCQGVCQRGLASAGKGSAAGSANSDSSFKGLHIVRVTLRDQEGQRYLYVLDEEESWKLADRLKLIRGSSQVRSLGFAGLSSLEARSILDTLGFCQS